MRARAARVIVVGVAGAILSATPGSAGKKEEQILQADVDELQRQVFDLKRMLERQGDDLRRLVELGESAPDSTKELAAFNANVDALRGEIRALATRFDDVESRLGQCCRAAAAAAPAAYPEDAALAPAAPGAADPGAAASGDALYQQAYADYIKDSFDLAIAQFRDYIAKNPGSDLADNAQYWIAMSLFNQRKFEEAIREFDTLLTRFERADNGPEALYRKGVSLLELNRIAQAVLVFHDVEAKYPDTPAARQAAERLHELASGSR